MVSAYAVPSLFSRKGARIDPTEQVRNSSSSVKRAKEFIKAGMFEQAKSVLLREIDRNPSDADLHFLLGTCCLSMNETRNAQTCFHHAIRLDPEKGELIGTICWQEAESLNGKGTPQRASDLYSLAVQYAPALRGKVASAYVTLAKEQVKKAIFGEAAVFTAKAVSYDPAAGKQVAGFAFQEAKTRQDASTIALLGQFALPWDRSLSGSWGSILYEALVKDTTIEDEQTVSHAQRAYEWNGDLKSQLATLLFERGKIALGRTESNAQVVAAIFTKAAELEQERGPKAAELVWDRVCKELDNIYALDQGEFLSLFALYERLGLATNVRNSPDYQLASGLKLYAEGVRARAIEIFKEIVEKAPQSSAAKRAEQILASPKPGRRTFRFAPFEFTGFWDWGGNGRKHITIRLLYADVEESRYTLTFSLRAADDGDYLFLWPAQVATRRSSEPHERPLYIVDDNGQKQESPGFMGGEGLLDPKWDKDVRAIALKAGQEVVLSATFPMISEVASGVEFYSSTLNGWQAKWAWKSIWLKDAPFGAHISNKQKKQGDYDLEKKLVGSWRGESDRQKMTLLIEEGGKWSLVVEQVGGNSRASGTWKIENGRLVLTVAKSDRPNLPERTTCEYEIAGLSGTVFSLKSASGVTQDWNRIK